MTKKTIRVLGIVMIGIALCLPYMVFSFQDQMIENKKVSWQNTSLDAEIMKTHPIIEAIYADFYDNQNLEYMSHYVVKQKDDYSQYEQEKLTDIQILFQQEIHHLLEAKVVPYSYFELQENQEFVVDFGTISYDPQLSDSDYYLNLLYRMGTDHDRYIDLSYSQMAQKICYFSIRSQQLYDLTENDMKEMTSQMLVYLGLDDLDDWTYTDYGYESLKAKLQIHCEKVVYEDQAIVTMNIYPLGKFHVNRTTNHQ